MNIGLMGGTFDPIHLGHLTIAEEARTWLDLTEVTFIPAGHPYFKAWAYVSSAEHRVNMLNLAIADKPYFKLSLIEIERPGPSYAVDTILRIKSRLNTRDEIFFIMGWDSLLTLHLWQEPEQLISLCQVAAAPRPGYSKPDLGILEHDLPGISERTVFLNNPPVNISASEIRERVKQGLPIEHMVPTPVADYIREHGLYNRKN